jgi:hypothetical protein
MAGLQCNLLIRFAQECVDRFDTLWASPLVNEKIQDIIMVGNEIDPEVCSREHFHNCLLGFHRATVQLLTDFTSLSSKTIREAGDCIFWGEETGNPDWKEWMFEIADMKIILATWGTLRASSERIAILLYKLHLNEPGLPRNKVDSPLKEALQQMFRLYALGESSACIATCRTVLELALKDKVNWNKCAKYLGERGWYDIGDRLGILRKEFRIFEETRSSAENLRHCANKIIHEDTSLSRQVDKYVIDTLCIVKSILDGEKSYYLLFLDCFQFDESAFHEIPIRTRFQIIFGNDLDDWFPEGSC